MQISPFKIERYFARYEFDVDFVLCGSDCESMAIGDLLAFEPDELQQIIKPNTRVIVVNTPHNPTGYLMPGDRFQEISRIARANGIILFSDEVYRESEYRVEDRRRAAASRQRV